MSRRIGLLVNPIAGMGGAVGLKGTDGAAVLAQARQRGASPRAGERATAALLALRGEAGSVELVTAPGAMGEDPARVAGLTPRVVGSIKAETTAEDMQRLAVALRDASGALGTSLPILGIPTGVKMQSAAFAPTPRRAGEIAAAWLAGETALRQGRISPRLFGHARVPVARGFRPTAKASPRVDDEVALDGAAAETARTMVAGRVYVLGPGTTTRRVGHALRLETTLLGVDAVLDGRLIGRDLDAAGLLELIGERPVSIIVGVSGGRGSCSAAVTTRSAPRWSIAPAGTGS